jgi:magnesium transporter
MTIPTVAEKEKGLKVERVAWGNLTWVNIEKPTPRETEYLSQNYPFHPLDLDDCLSRIQRPKIDEYKDEDYLFIVLNFPVFNKEAGVTVASQVSIFISGSYLVTLHSGELKPLVKLFKDCYINEEARQENLRHGSGYLLYRIVDRLVDYCLPILNKITENIEKVEDDIFAGGMPGAIRELSILRRDIISFRRIIWPMRAVIGILEHKVERFFTQEDIEVYFGDVVDHVDKIWDGLDECKEVIEGLNDTHDSMAANRTNEVMRIVTIIATILLPLTVVSGIYGMNIPLPFQGSPLSFIYVLLIMLGIIGGMLFFFRRRRWI